ncbi:MAG: bifunctional precorrin-2 dehydrogenase/sirohydrochlorin ferrochelatase [Chloroflexi bacterium]|nr:bifunctional precorrin-2 dehydrogenase/sirohydrochlorin ferrochelatase [Chloroflexota bacterium]
MGYFPVYLDLRERPCVVIGTGHEADRKVEELRAAGALVTAITGEPTSRMNELAEAGTIALRRRAYQEGDLSGAFLAVSATTDDLDLSARVKAEAEVERVLLNVVDITALCMWIAPAVVRRGSLTIAISTDGISPAMARFAKNRIDEILPPEYGTLLSVVGDVRRELRERRLRPDPETWQRALDPETLRLAAMGDLDGVRHRLLTLLGTSPTDGIL